jgi:hypothetical protein
MRDGANSWLLIDLDTLLRSHPDPLGSGAGSTANDCVFCEKTFLTNFSLGLIR